MSKQLVHEVRFGLIKASIWKNQTRSGDRHNVTVCRIYRNGDVWKESNHFGRDGKEIWDLLVVFGDDVLVFSDKLCAFLDSGDIRLDWYRWYRRAVEKSAIQALGAKRWIENYPDRIFTDASCTHRLPLDMPKESARYHYTDQ